MTALWALVLLGILIFIHELGHFLLAKTFNVKVLRFSLGFGPKLFGFKGKETEYVLSAFPLGGYVKMAGEDPEEPLSEEDLPRAFSHQPVKKRVLIVLAGPLFNILLGYMVFASVLATGRPITLPKLEKLLPVVDEVVQGTPAEKAGLQPGDRILEVEGKRVDTWFEMVDAVSKRPGQPTRFTILRDNRKIEVTIVPMSEKEKINGKEITIGRIGIKKDVGNFIYQIEADSFIEVPVKAALATYRMVEFVVDSIGMFITGTVSVKNLGGPITIVKESGRAAEAGVLAYFMFMALLSVNLGVLNLLPIPVLDGGHLLLYTVEGLKGEPLTDRTVIIVNRIGYAILAFLMGLALYNDIFRLFSK